MRRISAAWVAEQFSDLRPQAITEYLGLRKPQGWTYRSTAAFGYYGREQFPWERSASALAGASAQGALEAIGVSPLI